MIAESQQGSRCSHSGRGSLFLWSWMTPTPFTINVSLYSAMLNDTHATRIFSLLQSILHPWCRVPLPVDTFELESCKSLCISKSNEYYTANAEERLWVNNVRISDAWRFLFCGNPESHHCHFSCLCADGWRDSFSRSD